MSVKYGLAQSDPIDYDPIDYEAVSNLDPQTAEQFAQTVNKLKGKVTIVFITHQLPKSLQVDEVVILGRKPLMDARQTSEGRKPLMDARQTSEGRNQQSDR